MKYFTRLALLSVILAVTAFSVTAQRGKDYHPNTLVIKYEDTQDGMLTRQKAGSGDPALQVNAYLQRLGARNFRPLWPEDKQLPQAARNRISGSDRDPASDLKRIFEVTYSDPIDPLYLAAKVRNMPGVEYAEPKYMRYLQEVPNDPVENPFLEYHNFFEAWDHTTGSLDVVVAVVDGGVGYNHPDLQNKLWVNQDEIPETIRSQVDADGDGNVSPAEIRQYLEDNDGDYNGDGTIDLTDALHPDSPFTDGLDNPNDLNGYEDDLYGWDFWEAGLTAGSIEEDNDPNHHYTRQERGTDHGTHVAGIAAAETDNDQGIAAAGYNVRYMPVKAGGIPEQPRSIAFGFEAIQYAAENGADIINCSWGGEGFSEAEQDVIDYATSLGSLVVAAAGNEALGSITYPAGYRNVLAVGSIETSDTRAQYSNYGYMLDVLATGTDVQSAVFGNEVGSKSGTSMATPIAAGLAGLIKSVQPDWGPERIAAYIRATAVSVDDNNAASQRNRLGKGRLDAEAAVTAAIEGDLPGVVVNSYEFTSGDGQKLGLEQDGTISVELENVGASSQNISIEAVALNDDGITLEQPSQTISLDSEEEQEISIPIYIEENFDLSDTPTIRLNFSENTAGYNDFSILQYEDILFDVLAANNVKTSLAGDGTIGFTDPLNGQGGVGFVPREEIAGVYQEGDNLLFEGGLIIEANGRIYDAVRTGSGGVSRDFKPAEIFNLREPGERSDLEGHTSFHFGDGENPLAEVDLTTYSFDEPELSNVLFVRYDIENPSGFVEVENMYVGLFNDWDIGVSAGMNGAAFSTPDSLLYLFDEGANSDQPLVAVAPLGNLSSALAIDNAATNGADSLDFGIYEDFTDSKKSIALKAGTDQTEQSETDVSAVVASGPFTLAPRASATVGFVYAFGGNETELREQVSNARSRAPFEVSSTGEVVAETTPGETRLFQNYPNPFSSSTRLRVDLAEETGVEIDVFDVIGRRVAEIVDERLQARTHIFRFAPSNLSSGVYLVRLKTDRDVQTIKMVLVK